VVNRATARNQEAMMSQTLLDLAYQLTQAGEPFILATVVWCERPTSAKPGAQAIIQRDGHITGWIGGSCAQPVVIREAMRALEEGGDPYLLRLGAPETGIARRDVHVFPMTCTSGGVLDIYMEPHLPLPQLLLVGDSPVIEALQQLAPVLNFAVTHLEQADLSQVSIGKQTYILAATHGQYDEEVLEQALPSEAAYVGMVASRRRAQDCQDSLRAAGLAEQHIARLKAPAGLAINAVTPEEIAASILAELVQVRRQASEVRDESQIKMALEEPVHAGNIGVNGAYTLSADPETALDPVCGMIVTISTARHRSSYDEHEFFFCCPACKRLFERDPQHYLVK
jgi:xanthine dehydrogenase accessory factor